MTDDERREYLRRMAELGSEQTLAVGDNRGARTDPALTSPSAATKAAVAEALREARENPHTGPVKVNIERVVVPLLPPM